MIKAPELPTTEQLEMVYQLPSAILPAIDGRRERTNAIIRNPATGLLAVVGACALTDDLLTLQSEAQELQELELEIPGIVANQRLCTWKPRSQPTSWFGMETTDTARAYEITSLQAAHFANAAMELGYPEHADRYAAMLSLAWLGARNEHDTELLRHVAQYTALPLGIKNGEDGEIAAALQRIETVNRIRGEAGATAILLYRGGKNALTPADWERNYKRAYEATDGAVIPDLAHGTMRAHNIGGGKGVEGQLLARDHLLELASAGYAPAGFMMEASSTKEVVDPNAPYKEAIVTIHALASIKGLAPIAA